MKRITKIICVLVAAIILISAFSGCTKKEVLTGDTYTYWTMLDENMAQTMQSASEHPFYQAVSEATGIDVEFMHPARGITNYEAFQVLLASNEIPDMIEYPWGGTGYAGGPDQAIDDGVIISLNSYLKEYAPNYYNYMEGEKAKETDYIYKKSAISDKGNYYGFRCLNIGSYGCFDGLYIRNDLLKKWGLSIPETIDDWENVFKTAKDNGIKYPLTGKSNLFNILGSKDLFNTAWGVGMAFYLEGNKVQFGPYQKEYKDYVVKMADWMKKGYIDPDYVTNDSNVVDSYIINDTSIASLGYIGSDLGRMLPAFKERNPDAEIVACPMPVMKKGDIPKFQVLVASATDKTVAISKNCGVENEQRYKEAIKWCDYIYDDESMILKIFGIEGDTYTVEKYEDGSEHYIYTDKVVKDFESVGATNITGGIYHYTIPSNHPGFSEHNDYYEGYYTYQEQKDALKKWNEHIDEARKYVLPSLSYTSDEASEIANIKAKDNSSFSATVSNIILGKESIDAFDGAVKKLRESGYDKYLKIQQNAYDRYMAK